MTSIDLRHPWLHEMVTLRDRIMMALFADPVVVVPPDVFVGATELWGVRVQHVEGLEHGYFGFARNEHHTLGPSDPERFAAAAALMADLNRTLPDLAGRMEFLVPPGIMDGLTAVYGVPLLSWTVPGIFVGYRLDVEWKANEGGSAA